MSGFRSRVVPAAASTSLRRLIIGCSAAALLLTGGLAVSTAVQATTSPPEAPAEVHPIVGAWIYTVDGFPESFTVLVDIDADGTWLDTSPDGTTSIGSWEATGPDSFNLTFFHSLSLTEDGSVTMLTIRATGEVSEDGQSWTADYTAELTGEGLPSGEYGPGSTKPEHGSTSSRWVPRSLPWKPSSPISSRRGGHRSGGHRTVGDPHRAMLRWQPRPASSRLAPNCR